MNNVPSVMLRAAIGAALCVLAGCSASTDTSLTGNTPAQYSHVFVTTNELWFNSSATAGPDDGGWYKFTLSSPTTIDLVAEGAGNMAQIEDSLRIAPGSYSQVRLIPLDAGTALSTAASNAGAMYNSEADYVDSSGVTHQVPLQFLNPDKGIGIQTALKVPVGNIGAALTSGTGTGTGTTSTTTGTTPGTTTGTTLGTTTGTTTGTTSTGTTSTSSSNQTPNQFAIFADGTTDLTPFFYGSGSSAGTSTSTGVILSQHASAYDLSKSGGISGTLTLTNITSSTSGLPNILVSAQVLSADQTRHVVVASTTVQADGTFLLYPLAASTEGVYYDVVIHGPGIATIIIKSVVVTLPSSSSSSSTTDSNTTTSASTTTTSTTTSGTTSASANNVVAIGTLTPRTATSYAANTAAASGLPLGALVGFYQTLPTSGSVPYIIESSPIDPVKGNLFNPQALSTGTIDSGTYSSNGATVNVVSAAPLQGAGNYIVSTYAPGFGAASLSTILKAPSSSTATPTATFTVPSLPLDSATGAIHATISAPAGKYSGGEVLVNSNGTLVGGAALDSLGSGSASVTVSNLPAEVSSAAYYVTVLAWDSSGSVTRQWSDELIDMRSATSGSISFSID
jgi:Domain of unknown function (DUF4382)